MLSCVAATAAPPYAAWGSAGVPPPPPYPPPQAGEGRVGDAGETPALPGEGGVTDKRHNEQGGWKISAAARSDGGRRTIRLWTNVVFGSDAAAAAPDAAQLRPRCGRLRHRRGSCGLDGGPRGGAPRLVGGGCGGAPRRLERVGPQQRLGVAGLFGADRKNR